MGAPMRYQPQGVSRVSFSHRLAKGLAMAINPGSGPVDQVGRRAGALNGTVRRASRSGVGLQATSNNAVGAVFPASPMRTSDGAGTGDFTYLVISAPVASATKEMMACCQNGAQEFYFVANFNVAGATVSGNLSAQTNVGGASGLNAAGAVDGNPHVYVYTRKVNGGACDAVLYSDGIALASGTVNRVQMWSSSSSDYISGYTGSGWGGSNPTSLMLGWNRALSADEVIEVSRNPWQLFEAPDDWEDIAAGAVACLIAEVAAGADASDCVVHSVAATAEVGGIVDAVTGIARYVSGLDDAAALDDASLVSSAALLVSASAAALVADAATWGAGSAAVGVVESGSPLELSGAVTKMIAACIDTVTVSDGVAGLLIAVASAVESSGAVDITSAIRAGEVVFTRAPTGSGYQPQRSEAQARPQSGPQSRPAATQRTFR